MNQEKTDFLIYNDDDLNLKNIKTNARLLPLSLLNKNYIEGGSCNDTEINIKLNNNTMTIQELALQGKHNVFNSMAAAIAARVFEVNDAVINLPIQQITKVPLSLKTALPETIYKSPLDGYFTRTDFAEAIRVGDGVVGSPLT